MEERRSQARRLGVPTDVAAINQSIRAFLDTVSYDDRKIGSAKCGIYAFYDYDDEPIFVGQTSDQLRARLGRHLTNQRTDAVAMNVLDPFEVASIEVWPFFVLDRSDSAQIKSTLDAAEYTVFQRVLRASAFGAVLNEKDIIPTEIIASSPYFRDGVESL